MRPEIPLLLSLSLSLSSLLHPANPACVPRNSSHPYPYLSSPSSSPKPSPARGPSPTPASSPSTTPTPSPAEEPSPSPVSSPSLPPTPSPSPFSSPSATPASSTRSSGLQDAIEGMCKHTDHPELCLSSISSLLPAFGTVDARTLLALEMKACQSHTELARAQAAKLVDDGSAPSLASILQSCAENYEDALNDLAAAAKALAEGDKGTLNVMLSALLDDYGTCEDGFAEMPGTSPMASYDDTLTKLASNCLALAELIKF